MSKTGKKWLIAAAVLVALGLIIFAVGMTACGWNFSKLGTVTYVTNTYEVDDDFDKISIDVDTTEIAFVPAGDETCRIVCYEEEKVKHSATVHDGTLVIDTLDTRTWNDYIGISLEIPKMTVYLPQEEYVSLFIETATGDISIPQDFAFQTIKIEGDTCDVECFASVSDVMEVELSTGALYVDTISAGRLNITTSTGDIQVNSATVNGNIDIKTDTGTVKLTDVSCTDFSAESSTGMIALQNVVAEGTLSAESDTGDVRLEESDAAQISVRTDTGAVTGTLLSEKVFITETDTGRIDVPKSTSGGKCEITTETGDIKVDISIE